MERKCRVCGEPAAARSPYCSAFCRDARPCRKCGEPKTGHSPYCNWCRRDRLSGAELTNDLEWLARRATRDSRPGRRPASGPPSEGLYWCSGCRDWLDARWFLRAADLAAGREPPSVCRACRSDRSHAARLRSSFGMAAADYDRLLAHQGGVCAICLGAPRTARLAVDHNHITGAVRGLLCSRCNNELLTAARHDPDMLRRAAQYLESPPAAALGLDAAVPA